MKNPFKKDPEPQISCASSYPCMHCCCYVGPQGPQGEPGPQGPQGEPGPQGPAGTTPVVTVGTTTTLPPGSPASVTAVQTEDGVQLDFAIPQGEAGAAAEDVFASFGIFEVQFVNGQQIPLGTFLADTTGNIEIEDFTRIVLMPGYYLITYSVSTILDNAGYMQITPSYNGSAHIESGIYFKTNTDASSAYGSNSIIISVPSQTNFSLTYNSNVSNRSGAATVTVLKLTRNS